MPSRDALDRPSEDPRKHFPPVTWDGTSMRTLIITPKPRWWKPRQRVRAWKWRRAAARHLADRNTTFLGRRQDFQAWDDLT